MVDFAREQQPQRPEDPVSSPSELIYDDTELGIWDDGVPRAEAQARYASEVGCDFRDVRCLRAYINIFTRQEVWDAQGKESYFEHEMFKRNIGYYFVGALYGPEGYYFDDTRKPVPQKMLDAMKGPEVVPDDWYPPEHFTGYEFVARTHERAIPVHICEPW